MEKMICLIKGCPNIGVGILFYSKIDEGNFVQ
jgi:hypothetical protein